MNRWERLRAQELYRKAYEEAYQSARKAVIRALRQNPDLLKRLKDL